MKIFWNDEWVDLRGVPEVFVEDPSDIGTYIASKLYIGETDPGVGGDVPYAWIKPSDLGTMWQLVDDDSVLLTSGNITFNTTGLYDVPGTQLALQGAKVGDVLYYEVGGLINAVAALKGFDAYTYVGGSRVNPLTVGLSAGLITLSGASCWYARANAEEVNVTGRVRKVLVAGDISAGVVTVGLVEAGNNTTSRVMYANSNDPLQVSAQLWRPPT